MILRLFYLIFTFSFIPNFMKANSSSENLRLTFLNLNNFIDIAKNEKTLSRDFINDFFYLKNEMINHPYSSLKLLRLYEKINPELKNNFSLIQEIFKFCVTKKKHAPYLLKFLQEKIEIEKLSDSYLDKIFFYLGYLEMILKEYEKSESSFGKIKDPKERDIYYSSFIKYRLEKFDETGDLLEKILKNKNDYFFEGEIMTAYILYKEKKFEALKSYLKKIENDIDKNTRDKIALLQAEVAFFNKEYEKAISIYAPYIEKINSADSLILYRLGFSYYEVEDFNSALKIFEKISLKVLSPISQLCCYYVGVINFKKNKFEEALSSFSVAKEGNFNKEISEKASFEFINLNFYLKNFEAAAEASIKHVSEYKESKYKNKILQILDSSLHKISNSDFFISEIDDSDYLVEVLENIYQKLVLKKAYDLILSSEFSESIKKVDRILEKIDNKKVFDKAFIIKGIALYHLNKFDEAVIVYEFLNKRENISTKNKDLTNYYLGCCYLKLGNINKSFKSFEKIKNRNSLSKEQQMDIFLQLGQIYFQQKNFSKAILQLESYDGKKEDIKNFYIALIKNVQEDYNAAHFFYKKIIEKNNINSSIFHEASFNDANLYLKESRYEDCLKQISFIPSNSKFFEKSLLLKADTYFSMKKFDEAIILYKKLLETSESQFVKENSYLGLKEIFVASGNVDELDKLFSEYQKNNIQSDKLSLLESGKSLFFNKKYDQAILIFQKVLKESNKESYDEANFYLGECYSLKEDFLLSKSFYEKCLNSKFKIKSKIRLANGYFISKNFSEAENIYLQLIRESDRDRDKANFYNRLSKIYFERKKFSKAKEVLQKIISLVSNNSFILEESYLLLAKIEIEGKNYKNAILNLAKIINSKNNNLAAEANYFETKILFNQKKYDAALDKLHSFNKNFYTHKKLKDKAFMMIAEILFEKGQIFQAKATAASIVSNTEDPEIKMEAENFLKRVDQKNN